MNAHEVIKQPVVTEKSTLLQEKNIYAFWVNPKATKIDVKRAIKAIFGVDVAAVRITNTAEKIKAVRKGSFNKRKHSRKAFITLVGRVKLDSTKYEKADKETKIKLAAPKAKKAEKPAPKKAAAKAKKV